jgi:hypothetical protein
LRNRDEFVSSPESEWHLFLIPDPDPGFDYKGMGRKNLLK